MYVSVAAHMHIRMKQANIASTHTKREMPMNVNIATTTVFIRIALVAFKFTKYK